MKLILPAALALAPVLCLSHPVLATPALSFASSVLPADFQVKKTDNICGLRIAKQLTNPGVVDYDDLLSVTPQVRRMKAEGIESDSARGLQLRTAAEELVRTACQKAMRGGEHCSIWKAIKRRDGKEVSDVTGDVKRQLLLMVASGTYGDLKLEKVRFGRGPEFTQKKLKIELMTFKSGGQLRVHGGYASVDARWRADSPEAREETEELVAEQSVEGIPIAVCDEAAEFGLAAKAIVPLSAISAEATEEAVVPIAYIADGHTDAAGELVRGFVPITVLPRTRLDDALWAICGKGVGFEAGRPYAISYWDEDGSLRIAYLSREQLDQVLDANYRTDNLENALPHWEDEQPTD